MSINRPPTMFKFADGGRFISNIAGESVRNAVTGKTTRLTSGRCNECAAQWVAIGGRYPSMIVTAAHGVLRSLNRPAVDSWSVWFPGGSRGGPKVMPSALKGGHPLVRGRTRPLVFESAKFHEFGHPLPEVISELERCEPVGWVDWQRCDGCRGARFEEKWYGVSLNA